MDYGTGSLKAPALKLRYPIHKHLIAARKTTIRTRATAIPHLERILGEGKAVFVFEEPVPTIVGASTDPRGRIGGAVAHIVKLPRGLPRSIVRCDGYLDNDLAGFHAPGRGGCKCRAQSNTRNS